MADGLPILFLLAGIALAVFSVSWTSTKSRSLIQQWADDNGYRLLSSESRPFRRGPYFWTSSKGQTVYYVTVEMPDGTTRSGWIRCGSFWGGLWSSKVDVRWDDN